MTICAKDILGLKILYFLNFLWRVRVDSATFFTACIYVGAVERVYKNYTEFARIITKKEYTI